ncbi:hypothetical protein [Flavobacterium acetivorans]|nr:hypothetical protein [Flavobacterium sp. F-29]UFH35061.1 hypothetical protein LNP19_13350 [Flavobacterium sp. F-29]
MVNTIGIYNLTKATDTIMSYTSSRKTTWKWQWKIMHNNIKDYVYED